jgi:hypothetical protein
MKRSPTLLLLLLLVFMAGQHLAAAQVFCRSQFNLANEACSLRTIPTPARPLPLHSSNASSSSYELQSSEHRRLRSRRRHGGADPYDTACCRRLMGIDNACICQATSHLPVFMSRVKHAIKLTPVPGCDVSFDCAAVY